VQLLEEFEQKKNTGSRFNSSKQYVSISILVLKISPILEPVGSRYVSVK
jgi:hypothetical protein